MSNAFEETFGWVLAIIGCTLLIVILLAFACVIFMPHPFEGYYISNEKIFASYDWTNDEMAYPYSAEMWKQLVDANLVLKPKQ